MATADLPSGSDAGMSAAGSSDGRSTVGAGPSSGAAGATSGRCGSGTRRANSPSRRWFRHHRYAAVPATTVTPSATPTARARPWWCSSRRRGARSLAECAASPATRRACAADSPASMRPRLSAARPSAPRFRQTLLDSVFAASARAGRALRMRRIEGSNLATARRRGYPPRDAASVDNRGCARRPRILTLRAVVCPGRRTSFAHAHPAASRRHAQRSRPVAGPL